MEVFSLWESGKDDVYNIPPKASDNDLFEHDAHEFYTSFYLNLAQIIGKWAYLFVFY